MLAFCATFRSRPSWRSRRPSRRAIWSKSSPSPSTWISSPGWPATSFPETSAASHGHRPARIAASICFRNLHSRAGTSITLRDCTTNHDWLVVIGPVLVGDPQAIPRVRNPGDGFLKRFEHGCHPSLRTKPGCGVVAPPPCYALARRRSSRRHRAGPAAGQWCRPVRPRR